MNASPMPSIDNILEIFAKFIPMLTMLGFVVGGLWIVHWFLFRRGGGLKEEARFSARVGMALLVGAGIVLILLALPVEKDTHKDLFGILGLVITAVITLSSTTFVSNAMAGVMLRGMQSFRLGDFLRVEKQFGRITERGLFHTEIQTEDRDLTTLPNLYLVSHPFTVVRSSGTIVSATVSLGYDTAQSVVKQLLLESAHQTELKDSFVQVLELGDYSITYRVAGILEEVKQLLTARSSLRSNMLRTLHDGGIEIVSPSFMNQRRLQEGVRIIPQAQDAHPPSDMTREEGTPEALIFDKAEAMEQLQGLREQRDTLAEEVAGLSAKLKTSGDALRPWLERRIQNIQDEHTRLEQLITRAEESQKE